MGIITAIAKAKNTKMKMTKQDAIKEIKSSIEKELKPLDIEQKKESYIMHNKIAQKVGNYDNVKKFFNDYKINPSYNPITRNYSKRDLFKLFFKLKFKYLWNLHKEKKISKQYPDKANLIHFFLINGGSNQFIVMESDGGFVYDDRQYSFDEKVRKRFNSSAGYWEYFFHEGWALPFAINFPVAEIRDEIMKGNTEDILIEIEYATNPRTLYQFLVSKILEMIFSGGELEEMLKKILRYVLISMALVVISALVIGNMVHGVGKNVDAVAVAVDGILTILGKK
jgi:hypothetical protein